MTLVCLNRKACDDSTISWIFPSITSKTRASRVAEVSRFKKCNALGSKNKFCLWELGATSIICPELLSSCFKFWHRSSTVLSSLSSHLNSFQLLLTHWTSVAPVQFLLSPIEVTWLQTFLFSSIALPFHWITVSTFVWAYFWSGLFKFQFSDPHCPHLISSQVKKFAAFSPFTRLTLPSPFDLRLPAAKRNSITHAAAARSNLDAAIPLRSADTELQNTIELCTTQIAVILQLQNRMDLDAKARKTTILKRVLKGTLKENHQCQTKKFAAFSPYTRLTLPSQCDLRLSAEKRNSITHAAAARSNLDAAIPLRSADTE